MSRQGILWCVSRTWSKLASDGKFIPESKLCFKRTATNLKLDGSGAHLMDSVIAEYWGKLKMSEWRRDYVESEKNSKPADLYALIFMLETLTCRGTGGFD